MLCFARSGGTLLNQCLGSLPNVVILSEVNPLGSGSGKDPNVCRTVKEQAATWYGIELKSNDFLGGILELEEICRETNRQLIVRDWSFVNFVPTLENDFDPPNQLLCLNTLAQHAEVKPFAFIRDAIDVWISRNTPDNIFFSEYLNYTNSIVENNISYFKYEEFCESPQTVMRKICAQLDLEYSDRFSDYKHFETVNGDIQLKSRGNSKCDIKPLPRKIIPRSRILQVNQCKAMVEANSHFDYPTSYYGRPRENIIGKALKKVLSL